MISPASGNPALGSLSEQACRAAINRIFDELLSWRIASSIPGIKHWVFLCNGRAFSPGFEHTQESFCLTRAKVCDLRTTPDEIGKPIRKS